HTLHLEFDCGLFPSSVGQSSQPAGQPSQPAGQFPQSVRQLLPPAEPDLSFRSDISLNKWWQLVSQWRDRARESLQMLSTVFHDPSIISVETLDYPFEYIGDIVEACKMSVCVDAGHLILNGYSIDELFKKYKKRIPLIHLHGVDFSSSMPKDHQSIDKTPARLIAPTLNVIRQFKGVVSLELFNYEHLCSSLTFLNNIFMNTFSEDYKNIRP
ncbi:MAG: hypothetical protein HQK61_12005, partial [Desulfamplus sp.]|nr:hypothetical protein [Desulfamplus sp.]